VRCVPCNVGNRSKTSIGAVAYVGDAFEEEIDSIGEQAAALGKKGIPIFMFQEGTDGQKAGIVSASLTVAIRLRAAAMPTTHSFAKRSLNDLAAASGCSPFEIVQRFGESAGHPEFPEPPPTPKRAASLDFHGKELA